jgi:hypothetical protein
LGLWNQTTETATVSWWVEAWREGSGWERYYLRSDTGTPSVDLTGTNLTGWLTDATLCPYDHAWTHFLDPGPHEGDLGVTIVFDVNRESAL